MDEAVKLIGPLFTGALSAAVDATVARIEDTVADRAVDMVRTQLTRVLQHPTGYYESRIGAERDRRGQVVSDGRVIYGPWLEGVGSRNKTTRFKGYHTFDLVDKQVNKEAVSMAEKTLLQALLAVS